MRYKLMNDYSAAWPFWGGRGIGLCADGDPRLPSALEQECRRWAAQFNEHFDYEHGWPNAESAAEHAAEGRRIYEEVRRALSDDEVTFEYWERGHREEDGARAASGPSEDPLADHRPQGQVDIFPQR